MTVADAGTAADVRLSVSPTATELPEGECEGRARRVTTSKIIAELEQGRVPWVQPWSSNATGVAAPFGLPCNAATSRAYTGINVLILWIAGTERGFTSQKWLTFRQAFKIGAHVRKGEQGTTLVYADRFIPYRERTRAAETGDQPEAIPFQCEDLPADITPPPEPIPHDLVFPQAEALIRATGADLRIGGNRAFYVPSGDFIQVPPPSAYFEPINWHRTVCHELGHWSGAEHRLNRDLTGTFGSSSYAREELVAEMTGAFVCAALSIVSTVRHADYIASWLEVLHEDNRAIIRTASAASKAADYLLTEPCRARSHWPGCCSVPRHASNSGDLLDSASRGESRIRVDPLERRRVPHARLSLVRAWDLWKARALAVTR